MGAEKPIKDIELPKITLNKSQEDLLKELQNRSKSCSKIYSDILKLIGIGFLETKSHLVSHLMRELDSEIRKSLEYKDPDSLTKEQVAEIFTELKDKFKQKGFSNEPEKPSKYIESICKILNAKEEYKLIKEWVVTCSQLAKFAHRDGENLDVRPFALVNDLWENYESILFQVMGSPYALLGLFDKHFTQDSPTKEQIAILKNLLKKQTYQSYFYSNLKQPNWLKYLNDACFFEPINNPKPKLTEDGKGYYILSWSIFSYLEWISNNSISEKILKELITIINKIIKYKESGKRINNYRTDFSIYKILTNIPSKYITHDHIAFIKDSLETHFHSGMVSAELSRGFITKLISENNKDILLNLILVICSFAKIKEEIKSLMDEYWFAELIKTHKEDLSKYAGKEIIEIIISKIKEIKKEDKYSFSVAWIPTIEAHKQKSFPERYESQLINLLVECLVNLTKGDLIKQTEVLLKSEFDILKRIGFYLIGIKFDFLKDLLFALDYNPLEDFNTKHELYELFKSNATKFSDDEINTIIKWIEKKKYALDGFKAENQESILAYRKKEWYLALISSKNKIIQKNYAEYDKINDAKFEHPGFVSWSTPWAGEATPMEEFQIEKSTVDELIKIIKEFKEEKGFKKPTVRGFADVIQKDVEKQPLKYSESLDKFKEVNLAYVCSIVRGFINICRKNNNKKEGKIIELNWGEILNFLNEQFNASFWEIIPSGEFDYRDWFVSEVANLIDAGTKYDRTAFDVKLLPIAKEILLKLTKHDIFYPINCDDYVSFALNSTEGKILNAMLNYSLRRYRKIEKKWDGDIKNYFAKKIGEKKYVEVFTIVGQYLPQFHTLDKDWVESHFDLIFPLNDSNVLKASVSGLFFNPTVYSNFYSLFKKKGIYKTLLDSWKQNNKSINESLLRHICLGYAEKWEEIKENTLIKELLGKYDALDEIINFFWISAKNIKQNYIIRVKELWKYTFNNNKNQPIIGKLLQWLRIFNELDDDLFDLCIGGARFVNTHDIHYIIEYLVKYIDSDIEKVGKILLELVKNIDIISEYRKEDAIKIVEKLYSENKKQLADDICNKYFEKQGLMFLRKIHDTNNAKIE